MSENPKLIVDNSVFEKWINDMYLQLSGKREIGPKDAEAIRRISDLVSGRKYMELRSRAATILSLATGKVVGDYNERVQPLMDELFASRAQNTKSE